MCGSGGSHRIIIHVSSDRCHQTVNARRCQAFGRRHTVELLRFVLSAHGLQAEWVNFFVNLKKFTFCYKFCKTEKDVRLAAFDLNGAEQSVISEYEYNFRLQGKVQL